MTKKRVMTVREWVETWNETGKALAEIRREELRHISTQQALLNLAGAFEAARLRGVLRPSSGLIEQQAAFRRLRRD